MSQPSQVFPPWLTPALTTVTNAAGVPEATATTIVYLPLTYYGPSIPLGSLWTFGGSISPASNSVTSTPLTTTAIPSVTIATTTAIPTTILSTSASISTSNTAIPIPSTASSTSSSIPSSSSTPSPTHFSLLTKGQLVGVIVASVLGLVFLFVLALFLFLWCKGRKNRRQFATLVPPDEDTDYDVLSPSDVEGYRVTKHDYGSPEAYRVPGEGSPRHSGDEASSFLRQSRGKGLSFAETSAAGAAASAAMAQVPAVIGVSHLPPPTTHSNSSGSRSSNSNASGFGVLLDRPNQGLGLPSMPEHPQGHRSILSAAEMQRLEQENVLPDESDLYEDGEYAGAYAYAGDPLLAPPRILDPNSSPMRSDFPSRMSDLSEAEILIAERRRMHSLIVSRPPELPELPEFDSEPSSPRARSGLLGAIGLGLGGLANFGRRSWFGNLDSRRHSPDFTIEPFTEKDLEMGQAMLKPEGVVDSGPTPRPKSGSSGTSAGTIYHDAHSSGPATPLLPSLPRAVTTAAAPGEQPASYSNWLSSPPSGPPVYDDETIAESPGLTDNLTLRLNFAPGSDILDIPAPAALHHFASVSSLKDTVTGSSLELKMPSFPLGLDTIRPIGWSDAATEVTASPLARSTFGSVFSGLDNSLPSSGRIAIDLLEDAPPGAELGWRSITSAGFGDAGRRGTFGLFTDRTDFVSERGSLHSMRSHFNPSVRSTGSAPASRRDGSGSMGSASSRPSAHSLARTGSISSDGRRRHHANSPTLSAFGYSQMRPSPLSNGSNSNPSVSPIIGSLPSAHVTPDKTSTIRSLGLIGSMSMSTATLMDTCTMRGVGLDRSTSPLSASFPLNAPWAMGLDNDWTPAA